MRRHTILCSAIMTLLLFSSCAEKSTGSVTPLQNESTTDPLQTTIVTTAIFPGEIGKEQTIDGANVTLNGVYRSSFQNLRKGFRSTVVFFSFTVTNNTDAPISADFMQTCQIEVDGTPSDAFSIFAMSSLYQQFGNDVEAFVDPIPVGETVTGYIGAELYQDYTEATLLYTPLAGGHGENKDKNKLIRYTFQKEDLEYIGDPVYPISTTVSNADAKAETITTTSSEET